MTSGTGNARGFVLVETLVAAGLLSLGLVVSYHAFSLIHQRMTEANGRRALLDCARQCLPFFLVGSVPGESQCGAGVSWRMEQGLLWVRTGSLEEKFEAPL